MATKKKTVSSANATKTAKKFSIYDEEGNVSEDAQRVIDEVFHDYPAYSERMEACRKGIWDTLYDEKLNKKQFTEHCQFVREFDLEEEGPLEGAGEELSDDPKVLVFHTWLEFFKQEMEPFPKKKSHQSEWIGQYANFYYIAGWALMQFKEAHRDWEWTKWRELSTDELLQLAGDFANFTFAEYLKPILNENGIATYEDDPSTIPKE
jgi:hypothetical protein